VFSFDIAKLPYYKKVPKVRYDRFLRYRGQVLEAAASSIPKADEYRERCKVDPLWYINCFCCTYDPRLINPVLPMWTYGFQDGCIIDTINSFGKDDILIEKSRDMGASWIVLMAIEWAWKFHANLSFLLASRVQDYVDKIGDPKSLFWKIDAIHRYQPDYMLCKGQEVIHKGKKYAGRKKNHLENLNNGSIIAGEATTPNLGRGSRHTAIMLDEFAAVPDGGAVDTSTADATNCRIIVSTPQGTGNHFYKMRFDEKSDLKVVTLRWTLHPGKSEGMYIGDKVTKQVTLHDSDYSFPKDYKFICDGKNRSPWYDREDRRRSAWHLAQEVDIDYQGAGKQFFSAGLLTELRNRCKPPLMLGEMVYSHALEDEGIRFLSHAGGRLKIWSLMDDSQTPFLAPYVIGCDIATGKDGEMSTNSVAQVYNQRTGEKCAEFCTPSMFPAEFALYVMALGKFFTGPSMPAKIIWEENGPGAEFGAIIATRNYKNVYYREYDEYRVSAVGKIQTPGFWTTPASKRVLLSDYQEFLKEGRCTNPSIDSIDEMGDYVFGNNGVPMHSRSSKQSNPDPSGAGENHGDRVIGDALACKVVKQFNSGGSSKPATLDLSSEPPYGSIAWMKRKVRDGEKLESSWGYR